MGLLSLHHPIFDRWKGCLAILGTWVCLHIDCIMVVVYAPQEANKKRKLWKEISNLLSSYDILSIVLGDFNEVRSGNERLGSSLCLHGTRRFNEFISQVVFVIFLWVVKDLQE